MNSCVAVPKWVGAKGNFGNFPLSEQQADGCTWMAMYDFLLVSYSNIRSSATVVKL